MSSLVLDLQREALEAGTPVSSLLRRALVVARKLGVAELEKWISLELNGYPDGAAVPDYRVAHGQVVAENPYRGWIPVIIPYPEVAEAASKRGLTFSIIEIENLSETSKDSGFCLITYHPTVTSLLMSMMPPLLPMNPALRISVSQFHKVTDAVRNIVLDWSLKLEAGGVLGEGMTFTKEEKQTASNITYHIRNYIAHAPHSQIQQDAQHSAQTVSAAPLDVSAASQVIKELKGSLDNLNLDQDQRSEILADINTVEAQLASTRPKELIVRESLRSIRNILEGATGRLLASGLIYKIGALLG